MFKYKYSIYDSETLKLEVVVYENHKEVVASSFYNGKLTDTFNIGLKSLEKTIGLDNLRGV